MNFPTQKSPGFYSVGLMHSFGFEFGGVKVGAGRKDKPGRLVTTSI